jgi:predicted RNase H-like nuclease
VSHSAPSDPVRHRRRRVRAAASERARWHQQIPYAVLICGLVVALVWVWQSGRHIKGGTLAVAGVLLAAALVRLVLPERRVGMLVSRHRLADAAALAVFGAGLLVAGLVLPPQ